MCLAVKDDGLDLEEWLMHHHALGCRKFFVYDNNSSVPLLTQLKPHIESGLVEYEFEASDHAQLAIYDRCLRSHGRAWRWLAFLDSDEFIVVSNQTTLFAELNKYKRFGGLALSVRAFGSSGHVQRPPGGLRANYHRCREDCHVKSIVQPHHVIGTSGTTHAFRYAPGFGAVDVRNAMVLDSWNPPRDENQNCPAPERIPGELFDLIYINHYVTKSLEDFPLKARRGGGAGGIKEHAFFHSFNLMQQHECPAP